ncbi:hypothetical protein [Streptomyces aureoversilis]|uniref:CMP/dCMP-type deaminase domain-containing protein n=1 Tax=Streptomyces aureoversilis TaxID=67277 RepID=A0ABW0A8T4_9ACTN
MVQRESLSLLSNNRWRSRIEHVVSYIHLAIKQAVKSRCRYRFGAVIVKGGRPLAASSNIARNDPRIDYRHASVHAEEAAVRRVTVTRRAIIYVARVNIRGDLMIARPCARCQKVLALAGITWAHFTTSNGLETMRIGA